MIKDLIQVFYDAFKQTIRELYFNYSLMDRRQALDILNIDNTERIEDSYQYLYNINSVENGGSPYLQRIIRNAYEYLISE